MSRLDRQTIVHRFHADECAEIRGRVHALRDFWAALVPDATLLLLGAASYSNVAARSGLVHVKREKRLRPILMKHFGALHGLVAQSLASSLSPPAIFRDANRVRRRTSRPRGHRSCDPSSARSLRRSEAPTP